MQQPQGTGKSPNPAPRTHSWEKKKKRKEFRSVFFPLFHKYIQYFQASLAISKALSSIPQSQQVTARRAGTVACSSAIGVRLLSSPQLLPPTSTRHGGTQPDLARKPRQLEIWAQRAFQCLTSIPAAAGTAPPYPSIAIICFRQTAVIGSIHFKSVIVCASSSQGKSSL